MIRKIIILCLFIFSVSWSFSQNGETEISGDVNNDAAVDIVDALLVAQYYVGLPLDLFNPDMADVDGEAGVDILDALFIAQYYVGIIEVFPADLIKKPQLSIEDMSSADSIALMENSSGYQYSFKITSNHPINEPLEFELALTGSAFSGADYVLSPNSIEGYALISRLFSNDPLAQAIVSGQIIEQLPLNHTLSDCQSASDNWMILWKIANAYQFIGYTRSGLPRGEIISREILLDLDRKVAVYEDKMDKQAVRLPQFRSIAGPDYVNNFSQDYVASNIVSIFDLFNAGPVKYQSYTNDCVLANYMPHMAGQFVNIGTISGTSPRSAPDEDLLPPEQWIIQSPEIFGFFNVRTEIKSDDLPGVAQVNAGMVFVTLVHEMIHDLDILLKNSHNTHRVLPRITACSPNFMDFTQGDHPFTVSVPAGEQDQRDFVTPYAAGLSNSTKDYRIWEDVAESVTYYMLFPEFFRTRMVQSPILAGKYDYIRTNIFGGVEFENPNLQINKEYTLPSSSGFIVTNIDDIHRFDIQDIRIKNSPPEKITLILPPFENELTLYIFPMDDGLPENDEDIVVSLLPGNDYTISPRDRVSYRIFSDD